jgi:hypothetical protein
MSLSNDTLIIWLNDTSVQINRYFTLCVFCFGVVGNVLNILVLSQRSLRSNPCAWLFLISSFANLISIVSGLTTRTKSGWDLDLTDRFDSLCKIRTFAVFTSRTIAFWLITLASIDRWISSCINARYRNKSTLKNAQKGAIIITVISIILYVQMFYCYEANLINAPLKCYGKTIFCRHLTALTYGFITILCPLFFMIVFGIMTVLNIRESQRRTHTINGDVSTQNNPTRNSDNQQKRLKSKADRHLLFMLLIQVILLTLLTLPQAIQKIYSTFTEEMSTDLLHQAINNFIYSFVLLLSFIASGMPFYIYTLCGGNLFRKALYDLGRVMMKKILCRRS